MHLQAVHSVTQLVEILDQEEKRQRVSAGYVRSIYVQE